MLFRSDIGQFKAGAAVPDFVAEDAAGQPVHFAALTRGKTVVLTFWSGGHGVDDEAMAFNEAWFRRYADQGVLWVGLGAYAEYICLRENPQTGAIATMPASLGYEEAAAVPYGGGEALEFLRKGKVQRAQRVLVNGAGGSFGTFAVQLAKVLGAHVTAVDGAPKLEMLRAIGADRVIDYAQEDFTDGSETWDVIFDVVRGTPSGRMVRSLNENGCLLMANPGFLQIVRARWTARGSKKRVSFAPSGGTSEDLAYLGGLIEEGKLSPVTDRRFPLEQMAEAHRYAETGQKLGNIVVTVA